MGLLDRHAAVISIDLFHIAAVVLCASDEKTSRIASILQFSWIFYKGNHFKLDKNKNSAADSESMFAL